MPFPNDLNTFETLRAGGSSPEINTLVKLVLLVRGFRSQLDKELRPLNQSSARMEVLSALHHMHGDKSQRDVAEQLGVEGATITRMIDLLSKRNLVRRTPHPQDRRVNLISITKEGEAELRKVLGVYDQLRNHMLTEMTEQDMQELDHLVSKMLQRLDIPVEVSPPTSDLHIADLPRFNRLEDRIESTDPGADKEPPDRES